MTKPLHNRNLPKNVVDFYRAFAREVEHSERGLRLLVHFADHPT